MGLCDVNEDSYIFICSNSEITNLETSFQLCKKPPQKKKLHLCIISPWWISTQQIQGRKAKDGQIFGTSAGLFFQAAEVPELQPNQKPPSVLGWRSPNPSHPKWKRTRSTYLCLFVCFGAKKAKVDEGYSSGCGCGDFAVVIVVVVFFVV